MKDHLKEVDTLIENKINESNIQIIYDKPFDNTTIQGVSIDGTFKGITVKGNYEKEWSSKYNKNIDDAIRNIEKGLVKYKIIDVFK